MTKFWSSLSGIAFLASAAMYQIGSTNGHLTELREYFWAPLPLAVIFLFMSNQRRS